MLQRFPIVLAQVKVGITSENLINEVRQIIYSFYQEKKSTRQGCKKWMYNVLLNVNQ